MVIIDAIGSELRALWVDGYLEDEARLLTAGRRFARRSTATSVSKGIWNPDYGFRAAARGLRRQPGIEDVIYLYLAKKGFVSWESFPGLALNMECLETHCGRDRAKYRGLIVLVQREGMSSEELRKFCERWGFAIRPQENYERYNRFYSDVAEILYSLLRLVEPAKAEARHKLALDYLESVGVY
jgi:hypothetical protein